MRLVIIFMLATLGACTEGRFTGGPCSYDEADVAAAPTGYSENAVQFKNSRGEAFSIQKDEFKTVPEAGDTVMIHEMLITRGSCTPAIYTVIDDDAPDASAPSE